MSIRPTTLRARLTLWYLSVLAALLVLAWSGTSVLLFFRLRSQLDHFAIEEIETVEGLFFFGADGQLGLREDYHNHAESKNVIERFVEVLSPDGSVLFRDSRLHGRALGGSPLPGEGVGTYSARSTHLSDGTRVRAVSRSHVLDGHRLLIRLAHTEESMRSQLWEMWLAWLLALPFVLAAAGVAGYALAGRVLSPIDEIVRRAREITPNRLHERLQIRNTDDELGRLVTVFNDTLARLEQAFDQLRRFTSDCSHELRTPLAMIRSVGEVGLQKGGTREEFRETIGSMLEEVNRLTSLIDSLLAIARADSGHLQLHRSAVPLMALAREAACLFEVLMEEKSLRLAVEGDEQVEVEADVVFLRQALVNVIHNAVKYSPIGETVSVRVRNAGPDHIMVDVQDRGPGIPSEHRARIFDRFYRVDAARQRESGGGAGLGLAIAKWAVEANGGSIFLDSTAGQGCTFHISLPRLRR